MTDSGLASPGDTLDVNGTSYQDRFGHKLVEVPSNSEAQATVLAHRRRLSDLPDVPKKMNTLSCVLSYELFGLNEAEIAQALQLTPEQVGRIMVLDAYAEMRESVIESIIAVDADDVVALLAQQSKTAAKKLLDHMDSPRPDISLAATRDVLDRSGFSVKQVVEHQHTLDGSLVIVHVRKDNTKDVPIIDITPTPVQGTEGEP